jgi:hypothetical protein
MKWSDVGEWIKKNAGTGAKLIGSLVTGNYPGAIAQGVALISDATGTDDPAEAVEILKNNPDALVRLKELYYRDQESIRQHLQEMHRLTLEDGQAAHSETQKTVRAGDIAADRFVRWTRPGQSWSSLLFAFGYVALDDSPSLEIVLAFLALPYAYAGLRQIGKGVDVISSAFAARKGVSDG